MILYLSATEAFFHGDIYVTINNKEELNRFVNILKLRGIRSKWLEVAPWKEDVDNNPSSNKLVLYISFSRYRGLTVWLGRFIPSNRITLDDFNKNIDVNIEDDDILPF